MFTHNPITPTRLEVFIELVWEMRQRKLDRDAIKKLLQPRGLPGLSLTSKQAFDVLNAIKELDLVVEDNEGSYRPNWKSRKVFHAKSILLTAIDEKVLSSTTVEPWFARFFSYIITKENDVAPSGSEWENKWSISFNNDLYGGPPSDNPFNTTKYIGLRRWLRYAGLGWHDANDSFIPNPYERVQRQLADIFERKNKLSSDEFMNKLALQCPELDGGVIFKEVNKDINMARVCTRALATALRDLHDDGVIKLNCPKDSRGWDLSRAGTIYNPLEDLYGDKFDYIELVH